MELQPNHDRTDAFWQRYRKTLAEKGLHGKVAEWSARRAESCIKSAKGLRLKEYTSSRRVSPPTLAAETSATSEGMTAVYMPPCSIMAWPINPLGVSRECSTTKMCI